MYTYFVQNVRKHTRRVIAEIENTGKGSNPRYVVTNLKSAANLAKSDVLMKYCG
jgi:hypothetical protein